MAILTVLATFTASAQTCQELYAFSLAVTGFPPTNSDGSTPYCGLVLSSNVLYGTTSAGGTNGVGSIFSIYTDGTHFTDMYSFSALSGGIYGDNKDGAQPYATLLLFSNMLYGTAYEGGTAGYGSIFRINTDGSSFTNLHSFTDGLGAPRAGLIVASNLLYGTTWQGGADYAGSVFRMNLDGSSFTSLHSFTGATNDALAPAGGLVISGNTLYGTASSGGKYLGGVVFSVSTGGIGYTNLFNFETNTEQGNPSTNMTGASPFASMLLLDNRLYGTTRFGGTNGNGVVFALNTDGTGFTNMHTFGASNTAGGTNSDGAQPTCQLLLIGGSLYGTADDGGTNASTGSVFAINTNGSDFRVLYEFPTVFINTDTYIGVAGASGGLVLSGNTVYGATVFGGENSEGNVYSLNLAIPLAAQISGGNLVLTWTNSAFSLQAAPTVTGAYTNVPSATSPFTNTVPASQQFFRLIGN
jgi:uncharacterized repeat protein (TIGR03803 family)